MVILGIVWSIVGGKVHCVLHGHDPVCVGHGALCRRCYRPFPLT